MSRSLPPILFRPTRELRAALGAELRPAAACAVRAIAFAGRGLEIAHLQFAFGELTIALCSRVRADGRVVIDAGLGDPRLPRCCITAEETRAALARQHVRGPAGWPREGRRGPRP